MKKVLFIGFLFLLGACAETPYYPFVGNEQINGQGGFFETKQTSKDVGLEKEYPGAGVEFWTAGLPKGQKCKLIGYTRDSSKYRLTKEILKHGGNTATQSEVLLPASFENSQAKMYLSNKGDNETVNMVKSIGFLGNVTYAGYNVFSCK